MVCPLLNIYLLGQIVRKHSSSNPERIDLQRGLVQKLICRVLAFYIRID